MAATVTKLAPAATRPATKPRRASTSSTARRTPTPRVSTLQRRMGFGFGAMALGLTALSLSHLAEGVTLVAHRAPWEGWSVATAIDLGFVLVEVAPFCVSAEALAETALMRRALAVIVLCASAAFNTLAFTARAEGFGWTLAGILAGVAVPLFVGGFTHLASRFAIGRGPAA